MCKKQKVERMAKFMHYKVYGKDCENVKCKLCWCPCKNDAEIFYNEDYREVQEDIVVLSKEEYEILKVKEKEKHWFETCMSVWENGKIDGSKETAEKIFKMLISKLESNQFLSGERIIMEVDVENLAKQFGVEIEEL